MRAFTSSQFDILRDNSAAMGRIKRALRRQKDETFGLHMDGSDYTRPPPPMEGA
jgi:hypothetical protein